MRGESFTIQRCGIAWIILLAAGVLCVPAHAEPKNEGNVIEEVVVTARLRAESLQDVPVTISAIGAETLDRFQLDRIDEVASRIPNFRIISGGSGSGGSLRLRGVGSSAISAAFDSAVAFNLDGVFANTSRLVQNSFVDLEQVEVLKGPQSLYFGKSASAGVLTLRSRDPGDEFEAGVTASYESEFDTELVAGFVSGPLTERVGARLAFQSKDTAELYRNEAPGVVNRRRGEESVDVRLTLTADITEKFDANLKISQSKYKNDGIIIYQDVECVNEDGTAQGTLFPSGTPAGFGFPSGNDCDQYDDRHQRGDAYAAIPALQAGFSGGRFIPTTDSEVNLTRLQLRYDLSETLRLTSVTGYYDLDDFSSDTFAYDVTGFGYSTSDNETESFSQELRLESDFDGPVNFLFGAYYQDREILFGTDQMAFGLAAIAGPAPGGETHDWRKEHVTDTTAISIFGNIDYQITERLALTAGLRWTREEKDNVISLPYVHPLLGLIPLPVQPAAQGFVSDDIEFNDENVSPEVSFSYRATDNTLLYFAYKSGFKSGGIDNSALPTNFSPDALEGLIFESEEADGFEIGLKGTYLGGSLQLNATVFSYEYDDLQVQEFDAAAIQFLTFNASSLDSEGFEVEATWATPVDGLSLFGTVAYTDAPFTSFFAPDGDDLDGQQIAGNARWAGALGIDYQGQLPNDALLWGVSTSFQVSGRYLTDNSATSFEEEGYVLTDLTAYIGSSNGRWQISLITQNLTDEDYTIGSGARPFSDGSTSAIGRQDQIHTVGRGRLLTLEGRIRF